ncbi:MAG: TolC family protein [Spirochaetota bacterium]
MVSPFCARVCALFICVSAAVIAAEKQFFALPEVEKIVLLRNADAIIASNGLIINRNKYQSAVNKFFLPDIRLSVTSPLSLDGNYSSTDNSYVLGTNYYLVGTLALEEKLPWDMLIRVEASYKFSGLPSVSNGFSGRVTVTQPFLKRNDDGYAVDAAQKDYQYSLRSFVQNERDLIYSTESAYYDLVTSEISLSSTRRRLTRSATNLIDTGNKYKAGLINEITYLRLTQNYKKSLAAFEGQQQAHRTLKSSMALLMGNTNLDFAIDLSLPFTLIEYEKERSITRSISNDVTLLSYDIAVWKEKLALEKALNAYDPNGSVSLTAARDYHANYDIGVTFSLSTAIFERFQRGIAVESSALAVSNSMLLASERRKTVQSMIDKNIDNLSNIRRNIEINEESFAIAKKSLAIDEERFTLGLISADTLIKTEDDYYENELALLTQKAAYLKAISYLENKFWMVRAAAPATNR